MAIKLLPLHLAETPDHPPAMAWEEFRADLIAGWTSLLDSDPSESDVQSFLERYPSLLPRPYTLFRGGHHGPFPAAVITQPPLPSYNAKRPDFMWLTSDSGCFWAVPMEIERPGKHWFTKDGVPTAELTQALDQIRSWKQWFAEPTNQHAFLDFYEAPRSLLKYRAFAQHYVLIYGRRAEALHSPTVAKKRHFMQQDDETLMTFDRLEPDHELDSVITVTRDAETYHAMHVQPSMHLNRFVASDWQFVEGVEDAIWANGQMEDDRKAYLVDMLAQWRTQLEKEQRE